MNATQAQAHNHAPLSTVCSTLRWHIEHIHIRYLYVCVYAQCNRYGSMHLLNIFQWSMHFQLSRVMFTHNHTPFCTRNKLDPCGCTTLSISLFFSIYQLSITMHCRCACACASLCTLLIDVAFLFRRSCKYVISLHGKFFCCCWKNEEPQKFKTTSPKSERKISHAFIVAAPVANKILLILLLLNRI